MCGRVTAFSLSSPAFRSAQKSVSVLALSLALCAPTCVHALGVRNGLLQDCQPAPLACVSSQDDTPTAFLEPWEHDEDIADLQDRLIRIILTEPYARLVQRTVDYLRFQLPADDLELFFPPDDDIVQFRSARRQAGFDYLQNRRRMERIRKKAGLTQITVLRGREPALQFFETPFDNFAPSAVDPDAIIEQRGPGSKPMR